MCVGVFGNGLWIRQGQQERQETQNGSCLQGPYILGEKEINIINGDNTWQSMIRTK